MNEQTLKKGITYAAMLSYIRAGVVEQMLPAAPYLLRFNIDDYTYFTDYVRDKCLDRIMREGLYNEFLSSCDDLKDYLMKTQGKLQEKEDFWTIQKLGDPDLTPLSKEAGTYDERLEGAEDAPKTMSLYQQFLLLRDHGTKLQQENFLKEWKRIEQNKAQINFESGENSPLQPDSGLDVDAKGGNKTPYMLSNFYGNVYPIGKRHLEAQVDEESIWASMGKWLMGLKMFSVNGVPMTPGEALKRALILLCFNPDALGAMLPGGKAAPARVGDFGAIGFQAFSKPSMVVSSDLLDALIVLETTAFINKVKSLKSDPVNDWDWPIDFSQLFFSKLMPKPRTKLAYEFAGTNDDSNVDDIQVRNYLFPKRIMYVPVLDVKPQTIEISGDLIDKNVGEPSPSTVLSKEAFLANFPWAYEEKHILDDGFLDPEEAKEMIAQPDLDPATGAPFITNTVGAYELLQSRTQRTIDPISIPGIPGFGDGLKMQPPFQASNHFTMLKGSLPELLLEKQDGNLKYGSDSYEITTWDDGFVEDRYNGGTQFHMKTSGFVLQMYAYVDSYLWERVDEETLESVETPGLKNLLYLFGNRGYNLKGAVNPHYWNACMSAFFEHLDEKTTARHLEYTENDLQMFKNRMGAEYANLKMGLRLCWMVPSGMPAVYDKKHDESGKVWWDKAEYGDPQLIEAYKKIKNDPIMYEKFLKDKCHVYAVNHDQHEVVWTHKKHQNPGTFEEFIETVTENLKAETKITEYAFCFPLCDVLSDQPAILDPENWNIVPESLSLKRTSDHMINKLIKKMAKDEDFRVLFEYIFPIKSIIPEIATIYGMEFFKPLSDFMTVRKKYFEPVRAAATSIVKSFKENNSYDNSNEDFD